MSSSLVEVAHTLNALGGSHYLHGMLCLEQENPRSQAPRQHHRWEGQCDARQVEELLQGLRAQGIDLERFEPQQLFELIKGRTLW
jgi:hypothetical protein